MGASRYKKDFCQEVVDWLSTGKTLAGYAKSLGVSVQRIYDWKKRHKEFREAVDVGQTAHQAFFERLVLGHVTGSIKAERNDKTKHLRYADPSMLKWFMSKRFKDYQDQAHAPTIGEGTTIVYRSFVDSTGQVRNEKQTEE